MPIEIRMPALSPTMEEGTLAKWLVKAGDQVKAGDLLAEIETDKATMEFEAIDEGTITAIAVAEGTDGVKVGTVIATLVAEGGEGSASVRGETPQPADPVFRGRPDPADPNLKGNEGTPVQRDASAAEDHGLPPPASAAPGADVPSVPVSMSGANGDNEVKASPLARRLAFGRGVDLSAVTGTGPDGRVIVADVGGGKPGGPQQDRPADAPVVETPVVAHAPQRAAIPDVPHEATRLSNMRKTIARRLTESKQQVPHIYLTVNVCLDPLLALRARLNEGLAARGVKLSVNDLMIKALAVALIEVPSCNVMFTPDQLISFTRADISVAVSTPAGLITPVIMGADTRSLAAIATKMKELAVLARDNKLKPEQYQGGTASLSNMGMYGITQFDAVINPPQAMILAVGAGEKRPWVMADGALGVATVMSATGSFDHRAIDGADGAEFMRMFKTSVEEPLALLA